MDSGLPAGWVSDYDGSRWLYQYKPTGLTQFRFPKPGDEFPEYDAPGAGPITFTPEEQLAYEKQLKLRKEGIISRGSVITGKNAISAKGEHFSTVSGKGYFDPSDFMYLGGGEDGADLTSAENSAKNPLGFVAELPSGDTKLCADELAPVELDAGSIESVVIISSGGKFEKSLNTSGSSPLRPQLPSSALSGAQFTSISSPGKDDIYSSTPTQAQPISYPPVAQDVTRRVLVSPADQATRLRSGPTTPRFSFDPIPAPVMTGRPKLPASPVARRTIAKKQVSQVARAARQGSVDDIKAMPSSLQPHDATNSRARSKSTSQETWTPSITFVQSGLLQESKVSVGAASGAAVAKRHDNGSVHSERNRVSEWLNRQPSGTTSDATDRSAAGPAPWENQRPQISEEIKQASVIRSSRERVAKEANHRFVTRDDQSSSPASTADSVARIRNGPQDRVVESVVEVPSVQHMGASRGVQLVDISPDSARRGVMKTKGDTQQKKKHLTWDSESDRSNGEATKTIPVLPMSPLILAHAIPYQECMAAQRSPRSSPVPSSRLVVDGTLSPSHGQIAANRGVLVKHTERQPCAATVETSDKPLPPLPLAPKQRPHLTLALKQVKHNAFEQTSESIAMANAAMPSARRLTAATPKFPNERDWGQTSHTASRSALGSADLLPPPSFASMTHLSPTVWQGGHTRSSSLQSLSVAGLKPGPGRHNRSQSSASPLGAQLASSLPLGDTNRSSQTTRNVKITDLAQQAASAARTDRESPTTPLLHVTSTEGLVDYKTQCASMYSSSLNVPRPGMKSTKGFLDPKVQFSSLSSPSLKAPPLGNTEQVNYTPQQVLPPLLFDANATPKASMVFRPQVANTTQRPLLQVMVPSYPGLPSSPRPSPRFSPRINTNIGNGKPNEGANIEETVQIDRTTYPVAKRRTSSDSSVSSPTSSIFSSLRDSSISATSSMADAYTSPLEDLTAELVALEKNQARLVRQHFRVKSPRTETSGEDMPIEAVHMIALATPLASPASATSPAGARLEATARFRGSVQRPGDIHAAVRPAGTPISPEIMPKVEMEIPDRPTIPTLVVRAPTVKKRSAQKGRIVGEQRPPILDMLPAASREEIVEDTPFAVETQLVSDVEDSQVFVPAPTVVNTVESLDGKTVGDTPAFIEAQQVRQVEDSTASVSSPTLTDTVKTPNEKVEGDVPAFIEAQRVSEVEYPFASVVVPAVTDTVESLHTIEDSAISKPTSPPERHLNLPVTTKTMQPSELAPQNTLPARPRSFLQSLRSSWQATSSNLPPQSLAAPLEGSSARARSHSALAEPQGKFAEALAMARKQATAALSWQPQQTTATVQELHHGNWDGQANATTNADSTSGVGAAYRFFSSSLSAMRSPKPEMEPEVDVQPTISSPRPCPAFAGADIMKTTIVMRRRGPPVVVRYPGRFPSSPGRLPLTPGKTAFPSSPMRTGHIM